ncbi:hypothetical protein K050079A111_19450 [Bilophila wadsworthia]
MCSRTGIMIFFFFKQKTAYELMSGDWSSDVCSSDLNLPLSPPKTFDRWGGRAAGVRSGAGGKDCFKNKKAVRREFGRLLFLGRLAARYEAVISS